MDTRNEQHISRIAARALVANHSRVVARGLIPNHSRAVAVTGRA